MNIKISTNLQKLILCYLIIFSQEVIHTNQSLLQIAPISDLNILFRIFYSSTSKLYNLYLLNCPSQKLSKLNNCFKITQYYLTTYYIIYLRIMKNLASFFKKPPKNTVLPHKFYSPSHQFITYPKNRVSYLGISNYAKKCLVPEIFKFNPIENTRLRESILFFQGSLFSTHEDPVSMLQYIPDNLIIQKGEDLMNFWTKEADWTLQAPVDLRVIRLNNDVLNQLLPVNSYEWLLQVQVIDPKQVQQLLVQKQYQKLWKQIKYD